MALEEHRLSQRTRSQRASASSLDEISFESSGSSQGESGRLGLRDAVRFMKSARGRGELNDEHADPSLVRGTLMKAGGAIRSVEALWRWQSRYFVYDPSTCIVVYYCSQQDWSDAKMPRGARKVSAIHSGGDKMVIFETEDAKNVLAQAASAEEAARWAKAGP